MAEALLLNKITKLAWEPQDAQAFRILLSEDAVRLAKQSRFGPIHHTAMFSVQAIVAGAQVDQRHGLFDLDPAGAEVRL